MIGTVKIEFGAMNLYVNGVCVATTSTMAGIKHAAKRYNLQGYIIATGWKPCFFIWQFFKGWYLPFLKNKSQEFSLGFIFYSDAFSNFLSFALYLKNVDLDTPNFFIASEEVQPS